MKWYLSLKFLNHRETLLGLSLGLSSLGLISGCEDTPPLPNDVPAVIGDELFAQCKDIEGESAFNEVFFVIEDLQGSDTLLTPYVTYRNVTIPVVSTAIPALTEEEIEMAKMRGDTEIPECSHESCRMSFSWEYNRTNEANGLIRCDAPDEKVWVTISDINGNQKIFGMIVNQDN